MNGERAIGGIKATVIEVLKVNKSKELDKNNYILNQEVKILINAGAHKGESIVINNTINSSDSEELLLHKGDNIIISVQEKDGKITKGYLYEFKRDKYFLYLAIIFVILMIVIGGAKGVRTVLSIALILICTLGLIPVFIVKGNNPVGTSILICLLLFISTLVIIGGINRKTVASIIGTIISVGIIEIIFYKMLNMAKINEYNSLQEGDYTYSLNNINIDYKSMILLIILIISLGLLINITTSTSTSMEELERCNSKIGTLKLMKMGMNVGKNIIGSNMNMIVLVYVGIFFKLLVSIAASKISFLELINQSNIALTLIAIFSISIGLVLSIPITIGVYGILKNKGKLSIEEN